MRASPKAGIDLQGKILQNQKTTGDIAKTQAEVLEKSLKLHKDQLAGVETPQQAALWVRSGFNDPALSPIMQRLGSPDELVARIPQDPAKFQDWKMKNGLGIEKVMEMTAPKVQAISLGGTSKLVETNPRAAGFDPKADLTHTQTPDSIASNRVAIRGQNLTDARARDANAATQGNFAVNTEGKLRDDYNKASQEFVKVRDAHQRVIESAKDPSAAGDLALIFNYMKVLDPGSTVREGEFATAQNSGSIPERVRAQYNKAAAGERLSDVIRADFLDRSGRLYKAAEKNQVKLETQYTDISKRSKADPRNVISPQRIDAGAPQPDLAVPQGDKPPMPKLGERRDGYIFRGGNPADRSSWERAG